MKDIVQRLRDESGRYGMSMFKDAQEAAWCIDKLRFCIAGKEELLKIVLEELENIESYLNDASIGSMSRNNSETLASEILDRVSELIVRINTSDSR
jgi:hypothetical protein